MTCLRVQKQITPFINDELNNEEVEEFLEHIRTCKECREELEVYYTLLTAMKQLDEDKVLSDDYSLELSEKIDRAQERIVHLRYLYYRKKGLLIFIILLLTVFFSILHNFTDRNKEKPVTESSYKLRMEYRHGQYGPKNSEWNKYLDEYMNRQEEP